MPSDLDYSEFILPKSEHYCSPGLNEIKFTAERQTISLVLGSCISTVLVGQGTSYILAANHIVIADPHEGSRIATKSARQQIEEMITVFEQKFEIPGDRIICLHMVGGGKKKEVNRFKIHERNIDISKEILQEKGILNIFNDTGSYYVSKYSIQKENLSVFIENKFTNEHISFVVDLDRIFEMDQNTIPVLPISSIKKSDNFEHLVEKEIITFITGKRNR